jgi:Predicted membrane protein (DUF2207)
MTPAVGASDPMLTVATAVACGLWLIAAGLVYLSRRPAEPDVGPRTLDLGPEPPAVANFLVNGWRVTDEAVPATVVDLAARNIVDVEQRGVGVFYIRLRPAPSAPLAAYEQRVLDHLAKLAHDDVVPADALTTGTEVESKRWRGRFANEVVADAQRRGLSRDALHTGVFTVLLVASAIPGALVWALSELQAGFVVVVAAGAALGWIRSRHPQRETPEGLEAASRWLGVRAELAANEVFQTHSPLTVELWSRLLAYGAALGVAGGASSPLPMGTESDTNTWSAYGGRWRPVRITYPRLWPPGWGLSPFTGILAGLGAVVAGALVLYWLGPSFTDVGLVGVAILLVPSAAVVLGIALAIMAFADLGSTVEQTGPVLRLRTFGDDDRQRYYAAIDDGTSRTIRAFRVKPRHYDALTQGELVTVAVTKNLGCLRFVVSGPEPETAPAAD